MSREHVDVAPVDPEAAAGAGGAGAAGRGRPPADRARPRVRPGRRGLPGAAPVVGDHSGPGGPVRRERPGPAAPRRSRPTRPGWCCSAASSTRPAGSPSPPCWTTSWRRTVPPRRTTRAAADAADPAADVRTRGQRRADALVQMARAAAEHDGLGTAARAVPRVVVVTTPEQLAGAEGAGAASTTDGTLVGRGALTRIACDAVIDRVVLGQGGRVLAMDTIGRLATAAQQTALAARDRGLRLARLHHPTVAVRGAPRDLVVPRRTDHDRQPRPALPPPPQPDPRRARRHRPARDAWVMVMRDGVPWFRPPDRLDPDRRAAAQHLPPDRRRPPAAPACAGARLARPAIPTRREAAGATRQQVVSTSRLSRRPGTVRPARAPARPGRPDVPW